MSKGPDIERALTFLRLMHTFQSVERVAHAPGLTRRENDVEHSYLLTMLSWYLSDSLRLDLDRKKLLEYGLAHDLVEAYAGDTDAFGSEAEQASKHEREEASRIRIQEEFPEFPSLHDTISRYEAQDDEESRFVNAIDKVLPGMINYLQDGYTQKQVGLSFKTYKEKKWQKVANQPVASELLGQLIALFEKDLKHYFGE